MPQGQMSHRDSSVPIPVHVRSGRGAVHVSVQVDGNVPEAVDVDDLQDGGIILGQLPARAGPGEGMDQLEHLEALDGAAGIAGEGRRGLDERLQCRSEPGSQPDTLPATTSPSER